MSARRTHPSKFKASKRGYVSETNRADAAMIVDVVEALALEPGSSRKVAVNTIAKLLADKREEWLALAMIRAERIFKVNKRPMPLSRDGQPAEKE